MHEEMCQDLRELLDSVEGQRRAYAAPRSNAKSTVVTLTFVLYTVMHGLKRFWVIIADTWSQATERLSEIKDELENNEELALDFPRACGEGAMWKADEIITRNGVKLLALGAGQKIRGRRWKHYRPDGVCLDDSENDENTRNPEQRDKLHNWVNKAVLKAVGVGVKSDVIALGTLIHFDSVLARLTDVKRSPGWRSRTYRSVISFAERQDLWDIFERVYTDWSKTDDERIAAALAFYHDHEREMLRGTKVLWPEGESYLQLMRMRIDEGVDAFNSEKQNNPIDPALCQFPEDWFGWFDEELINGETWLTPDKGWGDPVRLKDCDLYGGCDPSMGKRDKHGDPSAIGSIAAWRAPGRVASLNGRGYRRFFVLDAQITRIHPHEIKEQILNLHRLRHFERFGVEAIQFQELFAEWVQEAALDDVTLQGLSIRKLKPNTDKKLRIQRLSPFIQAKRMLFKRGLTTLYDQFRYFPQATHDDGPDMVELIMETIGAIGWVNFNDHDEDEEDPKPTRDQIERRIPALREHREQLASYRYCATCVNFTKREGQPRMGDCAYNGMVVAVDAIECEAYEELIA